LDGASTYYPVERDAALLNVIVPSEAKVFVNGAPTISTGSERQYISRGLQTGASYAYEIRAEVERDGRTVTETKQIVVTGGQRANVQFNFNKADDERVARQPLKTTLLLRVPTDAKVFLSGKEMKTTGEVREFSTTRLDAGDQWSDYSIRVELNRDGQTLSKEANVTLAAGERRELAVDFDSTAVAKR
jgi:uncharacterized protein (TIGR03000 family)